MKFQSVYPLLYYVKPKLFFTTLRQIQQGVYKPVELFLASFDVVHPLHKLVEPKMHIISMKFQSVYPLLYNVKRKLFCTILRQVQQGVYKPVELLFVCCDVVHPLHKLLEPKMHTISMKFQCLPTFELRQNSTFLHRFAANLARCLQACRVVFCLL